MDLYLVQRGNEQWYCPPDQVEMWSEQGCAVFELTPTQIAGPEQVVEEISNAQLAGEASTQDSTDFTIEDFEARSVQ
jgi:hypothetical protein